jgi:hypothetical protein
MGDRYRTPPQADPSVTQAARPSAGSLGRKDTTDPRKPLAPLSVGQLGQAQVLALQRLVGNRAVVDAWPGIVQRSVRGQAVGATRQVKDPAALFAQGEYSLGYTPPVLNGRRMDEGLSPAQARTSIGRPTTQEVPGGEGTTAVKVVGEPVNVIGSEQDLLTDPAWRMQLGHDEMYLALGGDQRLNGPEWAKGGTLEIVGDGNDPRRLQEQVKTHEDVHAADNLNVGATVLLPWDSKLQEVEELGTTFDGATRQEAEAAMYAHVGGTPESVVDTLVEEWGQKSDNFHRTAAGATNIDAVDIADTTATVRIKVP